MALAWGAAHALTPGHGKTIVAAYLVGARATVRDAVFLGATTTITHTAGVFLLGLLTLFASQYIVPEQLYPWLEAISGLLVIAVGVALLVRRLHWHSHDHVHPHVHEHNPCHHHDHHDHDHHHDHSHDQADHGHSHLPPGADGAPVTRRSLLALGVSGGLLPCPAALVVMLGAIALNRVGFGLLLIVAFSLGLAGALTAIGVLMVRAKTVLERMGAEGRWLSRIPLNRQLIQALPAVSALFIVLVGTGVTLTALVQAGLLHW
jgi:ABC-type nickel/cobalt efflux system permease component RcnA